MLRNTDAVATIAVRNLGEAAKFYEETLGLRRAAAEDNEVVVLKSGDTRINVYRSSYAGTNKATALTWPVDDVDDVVRTLKAKGVKFEHYDLPDTKRRSATATCTSPATSRSPGSRIRTATSSVSSIAEWSVAKSVRAPARAEVCSTWT